MRDVLEHSPSERVKKLKEEKGVGHCDRLTFLNRKLDFRMVARDYIAKSNGR